MRSVSMVSEEIRVPGKQPQLTEATPKTAKGRLLPGFDTSPTRGRSSLSRLQNMGTPRSGKGTPRSFVQSEKMGTPFTPKNEKWRQYFGSSPRGDMASQFEWSTPRLEKGTPSVRSMSQHSLSGGTSISGEDAEEKMRSFLHIQRELAEVQAEKNELLRMLKVCERARI